MGHHCRSCTTGGLGSHRWCADGRLAWPGLALPRHGHGLRINGVLTGRLRRTVGLPTCPGGPADYGMPLQLRLETETADAMASPLAKSRSASLPPASGTGARDPSEIRPSSPLADVERALAWRANLRASLTNPSVSWGPAPASEPAVPLGVAQALASTPPFTGVGVLQVLPMLAPLAPVDLGLDAVPSTHLRLLVEQVLRRNNLRPEVWSEIVLSLVHRACMTLLPDVRHGAVDRTGWLRGQGGSVCVCGGGKQGA